ncbi:hypothetical protein K505DRAFT_341093 [Melanomma pulvis-pyrius CBS 109.77]|uniref:Uncharacterized protein n=1 Tax=Melanomma pulvis-pyrius CBS 109.77 TaxID=1314802 RepID=A0A6A6X0H3_9PLEO|nr:hypothetical protein K505DRAFT_341093 [Melanomma pulvis-pyrius CBS 109.77]
MSSNTNSANTTSTPSTNSATPSTTPSAPRLSTSSTLSPPPYTSSDFYSTPSGNSSKRSLTQIFHRRKSSASTLNDEPQKKTKSKRNYKMVTDKETHQAATAYYFASR